MKHTSRLLAVSCLLAFAASASAQFNIRQNPLEQRNPLLNGQPVVNPGNNTTNPYSPVTSGTGTLPNPYSPYNPNNPYSNQYNPYNSMYYPYYGESPIGAYLRGTADLLRSAGQVIINQEEARVVREQAHMMWLESAKRRFDLEKYIRDNTPTFTDEQLKYAKIRLKRIQSASNINEISSGTALNVLLDDLKLVRNKIVSMDPIPLSEDVLRRVNVSGNGGSLGLLRNDGRFTWPQALRELLPENDQKHIEVATQALYQQAINGKVDPNVLEDLRVALDSVSDKLLSRANAVPVSQYLEAKRFLTSFDSARRALQNGDAVPYLRYQKFVSGGKTLQQVVDYMLAEGLRFAPAVQGDESAYRAVYDAMTSFDVAFNANAGS